MKKSNNEGNTSNASNASLNSTIMDSQTQTTNAPNLNTNDTHNLNTSTEIMTKLDEVNEKVNSIHTSNEVIMKLLGKFSPSLKKLASTEDLKSNMSAIQSLFTSKTDELENVIKSNMKTRVMQPTGGDDSTVGTEKPPAINVNLTEKPASQVSDAVIGAISNFESRTWDALDGIRKMIDGQHEMLSKIDVEAEHTTNDTILTQELRERYEKLISADVQSSSSGDSTFAPNHDELLEVQANHNTHCINEIPIMHEKLNTFINTQTNCMLNIESHIALLAGGNPSVMEKSAGKQSTKHKHTNGTNKEKTAVNPSGGRPESGNADDMRKWTKVVSKKKKNPNTLPNRVNARRQQKRCSEPTRNQHNDTRVQSSAVMSVSNRTSNQGEWTEARAKRSKTRPILDEKNGNPQSFFWSKLEKTFDESCASKFLIDNAILTLGDFKITPLSKSKLDATYFSYKVDVFTQADNLINYSKWPAGSYLRRFHPSLKKPTHAVLPQGGSRFF